MFIADGPVLLDEALSAGASVETVYADSEVLGTPVVQRARDAGVQVRETAPDALAKVLDLKSPRGIAAVVRAEQVDLASLLDRATESSRPLLVLVSLQDPGNTGTLVRVAEATGCAGVVLTRGSVDLHNPKTVRATAGAVFRVPVAEQVDVDEVLRRCDAIPVATHATTGAGGLVLEQSDLAGACVVFVGAEAHGLPVGVIERCTTALTVPMEGSVESLNAAIAGSVVLFEAARQRRAAGGAAPTVPEPSEPSGRNAAPMGHNDRPDHSTRTDATTGESQR